MNKQIAMVAATSIMNKYPEAGTDHKQAVGMEHDLHELIDTIYNEHRHTDLPNDAEVAQWYEDCINDPLVSQHRMGTAVYKFRQWLLERAKGDLATISVKDTLKDGTAMNYLDMGHYIERYGIAELKAIAGTKLNSSIVELSDVPEEGVNTVLWVHSFQRVIEGIPTEDNVREFVSQLNYLASEGVIEHGAMIPLALIPLAVISMNPRYILFSMVASKHHDIAVLKAITDMAQEEGQMAPLATLYGINPLKSQVYLGKKELHSVSELLDEPLWQGQKTELVSDVIDK